MARTAKGHKDSDFRYAAEDLAPRDAAADDAFVDEFVGHNKKALNKNIAKTHRDLAQGNYHTREQVMADVKASRQRRRGGKK